MASPYQSNGFGSWLNDRFGGINFDYGQFLNDQVQQQQGLYGQEGQLANTLNDEVHGGGPNLAQQQLQNATNQNIQSQAGAVAGLRGLNPAMMQRLIAQNASTAQQQMVGQSAEARMQQQLAAQQQLAGVQGQMGQQNLTGSSQAITGAPQNEQAQKAATAAATNAASNALGAAFASKGTVVPGQPNVPGDNPMNDTKPYMLSPGEIVVPESISDDPVATMAYVRALKAHRKIRKAA